MIKKIISALKVISLSLILAFGVSYVSAWTAPTVTPPGGNVAPPINVSSVPQTKAGGLTVGSLATGGATLGPTTSSYGAATLKGSTNNYSGINFKNVAGSNAGTLMMGPSHSGFFNAADNYWRMYVSDTSATGFGDVVADDYYIAKTGKWASQVGGSAGAYGYDALYGHGCTQPNPKTGGCSCPAGSTAILMGDAPNLAFGYPQLYVSILCVN